jgi:hypothetical protein
MDVLVNISPITTIYPNKQNWIIEETGFLQNNPTEAHHAIQRLRPFNSKSSQSLIRTLLQAG